MPRHRRLAMLAAALGATAVSGCAEAPSGHPGVVATTTQVGDLVHAVAGPGVDVHTILQPGSDPHEYEPRPDDVRRTADARVIFLSGDGLDGWMGTVRRAAGSHARVVDLGRAAVDRVGDDPHWWGDPRNVVAAVATVRTALARAFPRRSGVFARRAAAYTARVRALDAATARCFARLPARERRLVTNHDAFATFAHRYGLRVVGTVIPAQTTEAQPSAGALAALARTVRREGVRAVFPEGSSSPALARAVARATGARADLELYGDTLGPPGSPGATYLGMQRTNAERILTGLAGRPRPCPLPG